MQIFRFSLVVSASQARNALFTPHLCSSTSCGEQTGRAGSSDRELQEPQFHSEISGQSTVQSVLAHMHICQGGGRRQIVCIGTLTIWNA